MDFDIQQKIQPELNSGERLLWVGRPPSSFRFHAADIFYIPFMIFWLGFVLMAFFGTTKDGDSSGEIFLFPLLAIGLYMLIGRFFYESSKRKRTFYGLTTERVLIISGLIHKKTKSLNLRTLTDVTLEEKSGGRGTIQFGASASHSSFFKGATWPGMEGFLPPMFDMIENVRSVYQQILDAQKKAA